MSFALNWFTPRLNHRAAVVKLTATWLHALGKLAIIIGTVLPLKHLILIYVLYSWISFLVIFTTAWHFCKTLFKKNFLYVLFVRPAIHVSQNTRKCSQIAKNEKRIARYFASLFLHFASHFSHLASCTISCHGRHLCGKLKDFLGQLYTFRISRVFCECFHEIHRKIRNTRYTLFVVTKSFDISHKCRPWCEML